MQSWLFFGIVGYLSGSVLYAKIFGHLFRHDDIVQNSKDGNPGAANAFMQGGFWCGIFTLCFDLLKGFLPVFFYLHMGKFYPTSEAGLAVVIAAPVFGHIFPVFYQFKGGKGIATTFGCLLGLIPDIHAALVLAFFFIFFSVVIRVTPHWSRTMDTFWVTAALFLFSKERAAVKAGFLIIIGLVSFKLRLSKEEKEERKVRVLWMR